VSTLSFTIQVFSFPLAEPWGSQFRALKHLCFHRDRTPEKQAEHDDRFSGKKDIDKAVVAVESGQIIGAITTLKRIIPFEGENIVLGGVGAVCTHPDKRKMGVSTALLKVTKEELQKAGADIAYLCTDVDEEGQWLYSKIDFVPLGRPHTYFGISGTRYTDTDDGMIAPINSPEIFKRVMSSSVPFDIGVGNW
jgi:predicted N-acetyltransferase YhbS